MTTTRKCMKGAFISKALRQIVLTTCLVLALFGACD
jgi:hypothetical protein